MGRVLAVLIIVLTVLFVAVAWYQSGGVERHRMQAGQTPEEAVRLMLTDAQSRKWDEAYTRLANASEVDKADFIHDLAGGNGSLRTYAGLETFDVWGLRKDDRQATVRARIHYSTAVGPLDDVRDIKVQNAS